jgi:hypothetical protein
MTPARFARCSPILMLLLLMATPTLRADVIPDWLPHYDLGIHIDNVNHVVTVQERVTWTNRTNRPTQELVFNVYPYYKIPGAKDLIVYAKTLELLRSAPSESLDKAGRHIEIHKVELDEKATPFHWREDVQTAMVVPLPKPVGPGEKVTVEIAFTLNLPNRQGRWGWWNDVTFLTNWYPILAYYDECGWKPTPFIAWHQPFYNEAGVYSVRLTLPCDQKIASTGTIRGEEDAGGGYKRVEIVGCCARDFTVVCSHRFKEWIGHAGTAKVRVLAFPEYEFVAQKALATACEAIPEYNRWFGTYPYDEFDIVQGEFPWNGNECSGLVMIDERVFAMPQLGEMYVEHLISHETLHQWWYNVVGTNGFCETFLDESVVAFYTARRLQAKYGRNAAWLHYKRGFEWLPNIHHDTYLLNGMYGTLGRKEETATVQPLTGFGNIVTLFSMTYDRGAKILAMIEERIGPDAFYDFMKLVYSKYQFRVLHLKEFQVELEAYTGRSWDDFFKTWLWGTGMADWAMEKVNVEPANSERTSWQVSTIVRQRAEFTEPTTLGIKFKEDGPYELRLPVCPGARTIEVADPPCHSETLPDGSVRVVVTLPQKPVQISVDPDQVQPDRDPANNHWKPEINWKCTPLYTNLDETDLTTLYDRWNITAGPWVGSNGAYFGNRGYTGLRVGAYRTQQFKGGTYVAYNMDDRDVVVGADALVDHWPLPTTQVGAQFDHSLTPDTADRRVDRGRVFGRYIIHYTPSLYLDQMEFVELYGRYDNEFWSDHFQVKDGLERYDDSTALGIKYQRFYYVPYWNPEAGYQFYCSYEYGMPLLGGDESFHRTEGQFAFVYGLPDWMGWLSQTRLAFRLYGGASLPDNGEMFWLGGPSYLRGLDRGDRQGSLVWIASAEWRVPLWCDLDYDFCHRLGRVKDIWGACFYDVGDIYINGQSVDGIAHSVGCGLRFDMAFFSFVERMTWRFDVAKVVNADDPWQFWFGIQQAF